MRGGSRVRSRVDVRPSRVALAARRRPGSARSRRSPPRRGVTDASGSARWSRRPNFRHPVPFAKELISLDDVSGGRLTLGIGSGGDGWDATMLGRIVVARASAPIASPSSSNSPTACCASPRRRSPDGSTRPTARGPIPAASNGRGCRSRSRRPDRAAMQLAATYGDTWVTTGEPRRPTSCCGRRREPPSCARRCDCSTTRARAIGRDPASIDAARAVGHQPRPGLASATAFEETIGAYADAGVTDWVVHWPRPDGPFAGDIAASSASSRATRRLDERVRSSTR